MPAPLVSPPLNESGAIIQPRQLQRWLDINPVSRLERTSSFITLPAFNITYTWQGYSDIVGAFNFEGPNNFSLKAYNINLSEAAQGDNNLSGNLIGADEGGALT